VNARRLLSLVAVATGLLAGPRAHAALLTLDEATDAITALDVDRARTLLSKLDAKDPEVALQLARLALYEDDCDTAVTELEKAGVEKLKATKDLKPIAAGCARGSGGTLVVNDVTFGVRVRLQDDADLALVPLIGETIHKQLAVLEKDLGVKMPRPVRVNLVRDQATLSVMTGLPYDAARTTGTVGIAKYGRVIMLSPRAIPYGYGFRDTLAHELTHLALSRGTLDRAPLWLQEGVAKREEARWREATPIDGVSSPDVFAAKGLEAGLGRPLDGIGPSVAMLPSAQQAAVVYAEVTSFVRFLAGDRAGETPTAPSDPTVLPRLVKALATAKDVDAALVEVTGKDLKAWDGIWRPWVMGKKALPDGAYPDPKAKRKDPRPARNAVRLGELLLARKHLAAARKELEPLAGETKDPWIMAWVARGRLLGGDPTGAKALLDPFKVMGDSGLFWALRGDALRAIGVTGKETVQAYLEAIAHAPLSVEAACGWSDVAPEPTEFPSIGRAVAQALCTAAKSEAPKD